MLYTTKRKNKLLTEQIITGFDFFKDSYNIIKTNSLKSGFLGDILIDKVENSFVELSIKSDSNTEENIQVNLINFQRIINTNTKEKKKLKLIKKKLEQEIVKEFRKYKNLDGTGIELLNIRPLFFSILEFIKNKKDSSFDSCIMLADDYMKNHFRYEKNNIKSLVERGKLDFDVVFKKVFFLRNKMTKFNTFNPKIKEVFIYEDEDIKIVYPPNPIRFNKYIKSLNIKNNLTWCTQQAASWITHNESYKTFILTNKKLIKKYKELEEKLKDEDLDEIERKKIKVEMEFDHISDHPNYVISLKINKDGSIDYDETCDRNNDHLYESNFENVVSFLQKKENLIKKSYLEAVNDGKIINENIINLENLENINELKDLINALNKIENFNNIETVIGSLLSKIFNATDYSEETISVIVENIKVIIQNVNEKKLFIMFLNSFASLTHIYNTWDFNSIKEMIKKIKINSPEVDIFFNKLSDFVYEKLLKESTSRPLYFLTYWILFKNDKLTIENLEKIILNFINVSVADYDMNKVLYYIPEFIIYSDKIKNIEIKKLEKFFDNVGPEIISSKSFLQNFTLTNFIKTGYFNQRIDGKLDLNQYKADPKTFLMYRYNDTLKSHISKNFSSEEINDFNDALVLKKVYRDIRNINTKYKNLNSNNSDLSSSIEKEILNYTSNLNYNIISSNKTLYAFYLDEDKHGKKYKKNYIDAYKKYLNIFSDLNKSKEILELIKKLHDTEQMSSIEDITSNILFFGLILEDTKVSNNFYKYIMKTIQLDEESFATLMRGKDFVELIIRKTNKLNIEIFLEKLKEKEFLDNFIDNIQSYLNKSSRNSKLKFDISLFFQIPQVKEIILKHSFRNSSGKDLFKFLETHEDYLKSEKSFLNSIYEFAMNECAHFKNTDGSRNFAMASSSFNFIIKMDVIVKMLYVLRGEFNLDLFNKFYLEIFNKIKTSNLEIKSRLQRTDENQTLADLRDAYSQVSDVGVIKLYVDYFKSEIDKINSKTSFVSSDLNRILSFKFIASSIRTEILKNNPTVTEPEFLYELVKAIFNLDFPLYTSNAFKDIVQKLSKYYESTDEKEKILSLYKMTTTWNSKLYKIIMRNRLQFLKNYNPWEDELQKTSTQETQQSDQEESLQSKTLKRQRKRKINLNSTESPNNYFKDELNDLLDKTYKNESTSLTKDKKNLIKQYIKNLLT